MLKPTLYNLSIIITKYTIFWSTSRIISHASCWSTCSIKIRLCTRLRLMTSPNSHSEKLTGFHVCLFQLIWLTKMQLWIYLIVTLKLAFLFLKIISDRPESNLFYSMLTPPVANICANSMLSLKNTLVIQFLFHLFFFYFKSFGDFYVCMLFGFWIENLTSKNPVWPSCLNPEALILSLTLLPALVEYWRYSPGNCCNCGYTQTNYF